MEDDGFRNIVTSIAPKLGSITRMSVLSQLRKKDAEVITTMRAELLNTNAVSLTTDVRSDDFGNSYSSFTAHFVDLSWKIRLFILICTLLSGRHTASALPEILMNVINQYRIRDKVAFICVDNASTAKALVDLSAKEKGILFEIAAKTIAATTSDGNEGNHIDALGNDLVLSLAPLFEGDLEPYVNPTTFHQDLHHAFNTVSIPMDLLPGNNSTFKLIPVFALPSTNATLNRMLCIAHTLQISVRKALGVQSIKALVSSSRDTVRFYRK